MIRASAILRKNRTHVKQGRSPFHRGDAGAARTCRRSRGHSLQRAGPEAAKKSGFKPEKVAGIWTGTWNNQTFGSSGSASMSLTVKGKGKGKQQKIIGIFELGGEAFGCSEEEINPRKVTMKKGKGENRWNKKGLSADWNNGLGDANLTFTHKGKAVTGFGAFPCAADNAYARSAA